MNKSYDIEPRGGSHYLLENGKPIARFNTLKTAIAAREQFVEQLAEEYERRLDRQIEEDLER
jgi:hypothetical protein